MSFDLNKLFSDNFKKVDNLKGTQDKWILINQIKDQAQGSKSRLELLDFTTGEYDDSIESTIKQST